MTNHFAKPADGKPQVVHTAKELDRNGAHKADTLTIFIPSEHANYHYQRRYVPGTPTAVIEQDMAKLHEMAGLQATQQLKHDADLVNKTFTMNDRTVYVADCAVHIASPHSVQLFIRFYVRELRRWFSKDYKAATVEGLPDTETVRATIEEMVNAA